MKETKIRISNLKSINQREINFLFLEIFIKNKSRKFGF